MLSARDTADRVDILHHLNLWAHMVDTGELTQYESLFTPDATLDFSAIGSPGVTPRSHREYLEQSRTKHLGQQHLLGNTIFETHTEQRATTNTACLATVLRGDGGVVQIAVWYHDILQKAETGWLIAERVCELNFCSPPDFVAQKIAVLQR